MKTQKRAEPGVGLNAVAALGQELLRQRYRTTYAAISAQFQAGLHAAGVRWGKGTVELKGMQN